MKFKLVSKYKPAGDQPQAIEKLFKGYKLFDKQVLAGITGSGKTYTCAQVIEKLQKPTLVLAHNKILAAQLYQELKELFPNNRVEYFISYYDYYQPESYLPTTDTYIEKSATVNEEIERLRLKAMSSVLSRDDVIIVASISCIYGAGNPEDFQDFSFEINLGMKIKRSDIMLKLVNMLYERNDMNLESGKFRVRGDVIDLIPSYEKNILRIELFGDEIEKISEIHPINGDIINKIDKIRIYPGKQFIVSDEKIKSSLNSIRNELKERTKELPLLESTRLNKKVKYDLEMIEEMGYCNGIENYSRHFDNREPGQAPHVLLDYFPKDFLLIIDESHQTLPQSRAMYNGDRARKKSLIDYGFRLESAFDNRPLKFEEFEKYFNHTIFVSATPGQYELDNSKQVVDLIVRPTGLLDPVVEVRPIVASALLLVVAVVAVVSFQNWNTTFQSTILTEVESDSNSQIDIENIVGDSIYLKSSENNLTISSIRVGNVNCILNENVSLNKGVNKVDISGCSLGQDGSKDILVSTNKGVVIEKQTLEYANTELNFNLQYQNPTPNDNEIIESGSSITINISSFYELISCKLVVDNSIETNYSMNVSSNNCFYTLNSISETSIYYVEVSSLILNNTYNSSSTTRTIITSPVYTFTHTSLSDFSGGVDSNTDITSKPNSIILDYIIPSNEFESTSGWTYDVWNTGTCSWCTPTHYIGSSRTTGGSGIGHILANNIYVPTDARYLKYSSNMAGGGPGGNYYQWLYINSSGTDIESGTFFSWVNRSFDISAYAGQTITIDFRTWTGCGGACNPYHYIDDIYFADNSHNYINSYQDLGTFTSKTIDLVNQSNLISLNWDSNLTAQTSLRFQIAGNNDASTWNYLGPDGTSNTYFTTTGTNTDSSLDGNRYFRYRAYLNTTNNTQSPEIYSVSLKYLPINVSVETTNSDFNDGVLSNVETFNGGLVLALNSYILNGDFESTSGWTYDVWNTGTCGSCSPTHYIGAFRANGGSGTGHILTNNVYVPTNARYMKYYSNMAGGGAGGNYHQWLYINSSGTNIESGTFFSWVERTFDISAYAGQTITIDFRAWTGCGGNCNAYHYIDDLHFTDALDNDVGYYSLNGNYTSSVFDFTNVTNFTKIEYDADLPSDTSIVLDLGFGNVSSPDSSWIWLTNVSSGFNISLYSSRYVQYNLSLNTNNDIYTPTFEEIRIYYE